MIEEKLCDESFTAKFYLGNEQTLNEDNMNNLIFDLHEIVGDTFNAYIGRSLEYPYPKLSDNNESLIIAPFASDAADSYMVVDLEIEPGEQGKNESLLDSLKYISERIRDPSKANNTFNLFKRDFSDKVFVSNGLLAFKDDVPQSRELATKFYDVLEIEEDPINTVKSFKLRAWAYPQFLTSNIYSGNICLNRLAFVSLHGLLDSWFHELTHVLSYAVNFKEPLDNLNYQRTGICAVDDKVDYSILAFYDHPYSEKCSKLFSKRIMDLLIREGLDDKSGRLEELLKPENNVRSERLPIQLCEEYWSLKQELRNFCREDVFDYLKTKYADMLSEDQVVNETTISLQSNYSIEDFSGLLLTELLDKTEPLHFLKIVSGCYTDIELKDMINMLK